MASMWCLSRPLSAFRLSVSVSLRVFVFSLPAQVLAAPPSSGVFGTRTGCGAPSQDCQLPALQNEQWRAGKESDWVEPGNKDVEMSKCGKPNVVELRG